MTVHYVKSWPWSFEAIMREVKTHDIRDSRERDYKIGDQMVLQEFDPRTGNYTGAQCRVMITYH